MLFKESGEALRGKSDIALPLHPIGDLIQTQPGVFNVFDEHEESGLRVQRRRGSGRLFAGRESTLPAVDGFFGAEISKLTPGLDPVQFAVFVQVVQHRMARISQPLGKLGGRESVGTAPDPMGDCCRQTSVFGESDSPMVPKALAVKLGLSAQRVPLAVVSVAPEITDLLEESSHRDKRIVQILSQLGDHPAFTAIE